MAISNEAAAKFSAQVYALVRACPAGRVTTYGGLGKALGYPRGARMIGWIMNETPDRQGIPAQRVIAKDGKLSGVAEHTPLPEAGSGGSQYEAVAFDGKGNVVVMAETGAIAVLDADCAKVIASSTIDWTSANPLVDGQVEDNSLGEGLVVLDETHVLVALEKRPSAIVELGPKGDAPRGFSPGARASSAFSPPSELVALAAWKVDDAHAPDLSELTIGPDGALWALSQQGNTIVRFERTLRPGEARARVTDHVNLPSDLEGVEGLAFDGDRPVVARDRSATKKNVFVLDPIAL